MFCVCAAFPVRQRFSSVVLSDRMDGLDDLCHTRVVQAAVGVARQMIVPVAHEGGVRDHECGKTFPPIVEMVGKVDAVKKWWRVDGMDRQACRSSPDGLDATQICEVAQPADKRTEVTAKSSRSSRERA